MWVLTHRWQSGVVVGASGFRSLFKTRSLEKSGKALPFVLTAVLLECASASPTVAIQGDDVHDFHRHDGHTDDG